MKILLSFFFNKYLNMKYLELQYLIFSVKENKNPKKLYIAIECALILKPKTFERNFTRHIR